MKCVLPDISENTGTETNNNKKGQTQYYAAFILRDVSHEKPTSFPPYFNKCNTASDLLVDLYPFCNAESK